MNRLFYGNFDFEYQLRGGVKLPPAVVRRRNTELSLLWALLADSEDWLEVPADIETNFFKHLEESGLPLPRLIAPGDSIPADAEFCPWGWSPQAIRSAKQRGVLIKAPPPEVVPTINSRRFSLALETEWKVGISGSALVTSDDELASALLQIPDDTPSWLLKAEFGMAGRERFRGEGREPSESAVRWMRKRLGLDGAVIFEPVVDIVAEAGLQFTIPVSGPPILEGITPLLSDATGTYRGSRFDDDPSFVTEWSEAVAVATQAANRIQAMGYFGPLGIDAAKYRSDDGSIHLRPLQDINVRFTMGRLSLGLRKILEPREIGEWRHQIWPTDSLAAAENFFTSFQQSLSSRCRGIRTSPFQIAGQPVGHGTVAVLTRNS